MSCKGFRKSYLAHFHSLEHFVSDGIWVLFQGRRHVLCLGESAPSEECSFADAENLYGYEKCREKKLPRAGIGLIGSFESPGAWWFWRGADSLARERSGWLVLWVWEKRCARSPCGVKERMQKECNNDSWTVELVASENYVVGRGERHFFSCSPGILSHN